MWTGLKPRACTSTCTPDRRVISTDSSVTQLLQRLDPKRFVRIHRSAAVNTARIRELRSLSHGDFALTLKDGTELTLSRAYRAHLEGWLRQPI